MTYKENILHEKVYSKSVYVQRIMVKVLQSDTNLLFSFSWLRWPWWMWWVLEYRWSKQCRTFWNSWQISHCSWWQSKSTWVYGEDDDLTLKLYQIISFPFKFLDYSVFQAISNADFWQIAGIAALERANSDVELTFRGGRQDCATSPTTDAQDNFPSPNFSGEEMFAWFEEEFDMSPDEVLVSTVQNFMQT